MEKIREEDALVERIKKELNQEEVFQLQYEYGHRLSVRDYEGHNTFHRNDYYFYASRFKNIREMYYATRNWDDGGDCGRYVAMSARGDLMVSRNNIMDYMVGRSLRWMAEYMVRKKSLLIKNEYSVMGEYLRRIESGETGKESVIVIKDIGKADVDRLLDNIAMCEGESRHSYSYREIEGAVLSAKWCWHLQQLTISSKFYNEAMLKELLKCKFNQDKWEERYAYGGIDARNTFLCEEGYERFMDRLTRLSLSDRIKYYFVSEDPDNHKPIIPARMDPIYDASAMLDGVILEKHEMANRGYILKPLFDKDAARYNEAAAKFNI
jgi:hypothetical protein